MGGRRENNFCTNIERAQCEEHKRIWRRRKSHEIELEPLLMEIKLLH